jgi:hypothetical protein
MTVFINNVKRYSLRILILKIFVLFANYVNVGQKRDTLGKLLLEVAGVSAFFVRTVEYLEAVFGK